MRLAEFKKIANLLAREHKLLVKEGTNWSANIKEKIIYFRKEDIYSLPEDHILGLLLHETAHIHYTTISKLPDKNKEITHATMNALEDIAIEHIISKDYPNAGEILDETREEILDNLVRILPNLTTITDHEKALLYSVVKFLGRGWKKGIEDYEKLGEKIAKIMTKEKNNILSRKKTEDLIPLAQKIVELLIKEFGELPESTKRRIGMEALQHTESSGTGEQIQDKKQIVNSLKGGDKGYGGIGTAYTGVTFIDSIGDKAQIVGQQLRRILKRNQAMEYGGKYRTGKLMNKRLHRIKTVKDRRPFGRKIIKTNQSYAFALSSDVSGSMTSRASRLKERDYALTSMFMVSEALRIAGIPRSLAVFASKPAKISTMHKLMVGWDEITNSSTIQSTDTGNTNIDLAIDDCRKELQNIKAEKKIMIILTDGSSDPTTLRTSYEKTIKSGIHPIAIVIDGPYGTSGYLKPIFDKNNLIIINNAQEANTIDEAFIKILRETIKLSP